MDEGFLRDHGGSLREDDVRFERYFVDVLRVDAGGENLSRG